MTRRRNWSRLPPELLQRIVEKLEEIADPVRFGSICKPRQSASKSKTNRQFLPWLLLPSRNQSDIHRFFSLSENKIYTLNLPGTHDQAIYESLNGFFLTQDHYGMKNTIHLLNPITRTQISLPPLPPLPPTAYYNVQRWKLIQKSGSTIVMLSVGFGPIYICEKGEGAEWGEWRDIAWVPICTKLEFTFHQDKYFVLDGRQHLHN